MIKIIAIGKMKEKAHRQIIEEFDKRLQSIHRVEMIELKPAKPSLSVDGIINDESQRILNKIDDHDYVVLLDLKGKEYTSEKFSEMMMNTLGTLGNMTFVIGGSHGVNKAVFDRANIRWKLSSLTFPHQFVRFLLYEQIYRSFMIEQNHPYHK